MIKNKNVATESVIKRSSNNKTRCVYSKPFSMTNAALVHLIGKMGQKLSMTEAMHGNSLQADK